MWFTRCISRHSPTWRAIALCLVLSLCAACSATSTGGRAGGGTATVEREKKPPPERAARSHEQAIALMTDERWDEAEAELTGLVAQFDEFPGPHVNLAIIYAREGRYTEALAATENALEIDPDFAPANNQLGMLLRREGRFDEAEAAYRRAIAADPAYAFAHLNLGILLDIYLRRPAEALEQYSLYQAALPEPDERVARWIIDLERRAGVGSGAVAQGDSQ